MKLIYKFLKAGKLPLALAVKTFKSNPDNNYSDKKYGVVLGPSHMERGINGEWIQVQNTSKDVSKDGVVKSGDDGSIKKSTPKPQPVKLKVTAVEVRREHLNKAHAVERLKKENDKLKGKVKVEKLKKLKEPSKWDNFKKEVKEIYFSDDPVNMPITVDTGDPLGPSFSLIPIYVTDDKGKTITKKTTPKRETAEALVEADIATKPFVALQFVSAPITTTFTIGGSYLGAKGGGWIGKKADQALGGSGETGEFIGSLGGGIVGGHIGYKIGSPLLFQWDNAVFQNEIGEPTYHGEFDDTQSKEINLGETTTTYSGKTPNTLTMSEAELFILDLKDIAQLKEFASKYGYELPKGIDRYRGEELDKVFLKVLKQHNTYARVVSAENPELAVQYLTTVNEGTPGSMDGMPIGHHGLYTMRETGYSDITPGNGTYSGIIQRKTDFSGPRSTWIKKNTFPMQTTEQANQPFHDITSEYYRTVGKEVLQHNLQVRDRISSISSSPEEYERLFLEAYKSGEFIDENKYMWNWLEQNHPEVAHPNSSGLMFSDGQNSQVIIGGNVGEQPVRFLRFNWSPGTSTRGFSRNFKNGGKLIKNKLIKKKC